MIEEAIHYEALEELVKFSPDTEQPLVDSATGLQLYSANEGRTVGLYGEPGSEADKLIKALESPHEISVRCDGTPFVIVDRKACPDSVRDTILQMVMTQGEAALHIYPTRLGEDQRVMVVSLDAPPETAYKHVGTSRILNASHDIGNEGV